MGRKSKNLPKIFKVNWYQTNENGEFSWPGFNENIRVLKWMFDRIDNVENNVIKTPIGYIPNYEGFDLTGLNINKQGFEKNFIVEKNEWKKEIEIISNYLLKTFGNRLPVEMKNQIREIKNNIDNM
jgi:phosphoenolpyruvate carboxykinase (GTP)